ncbi:hypothetical protein ACFFUT_09055 [Pseudohalocynthiibacter aestuariivivens]|jgi:hypothetical protein|uniref:Uncharacterized protein n=1 Tax=Pseudohalocynthiibacter aestuariivivens TaxID=1591409 RepID=A0ABV5JEN7_9RHOB|nr:MULTISPECIES: hypothetical protein [Pseudohalocynthiibacter]MBS9716945.1 hypothetical protein [Pseudohalocynthiibacter aestuariivivens]MCK0101958.1 hypothetical protein [Pseudohalocynthiibacter sp. F2068]
MSFENLKAAALLLMDEIQKRPEDAHVLQEQLREKIAEFKAMGLPVPEDLAAFELALEEEEAEELFDNMPL